MKKSLLTLVVASLTLSACQTQPSLPVTQQTPAQIAPATASSAKPTAAASTAPLTRASSRPTPSLTASAKPSSQTPVSSQTQTSAIQPAASQPQAPEILISRNYNTETLVAGLRIGNTEADAKAIAARHGMTVDRYISGIRTVVFKTQGQEVTKLLESLKAETGLEYIEADQIASQKPDSEKAVTESFRLKAGLEVNDKYFAEQYGLRAMNVPEAWSLSRGANTIIAVIDTGVAVGHADLDGRLVDGYDAFSQKAGPKAGDVSSLNYIMSSYKHGSHVAGIAAAATDNGKGIAGVAPEAKIMPIKIFPDFSDMIKSIFASKGDDAQTIISILADSIVWAADHGADVINMSLAVNEHSETIDRAVQYALDKKVTVVVAAGNDRQLNNARNYLAAIPGVIGVGATDEANNVTKFSNSGDYVSVAAPGFDIISTVPSFLSINPYVKMSGTSMAAPAVAGVAALLKSKYGATATPSWIKQRLEQTALDRGEVGRDDLYGHGLVNAYKALGGN